MTTTAVVMTVIYFVIAIITMGIASTTEGVGGEILAGLFWPLLMLAVLVAVIVMGLVKVGKLIGAKLDRLANKLNM